MKDFKEHYQPNESVKRYFSDEAQEWNKHYQGGGVFLKVFDSLFRKALVQRWQFTMQYCLPAEGKSFLDVGCGTGVHSIALAKSGAEKIVGVDFAPGMIGFAKQKAKEEGVEAKCEFIIGDFMKAEFKKEYDVVYAMGVFDYIEDPVPFWKKMADASTGAVIGAFPGRDFFRRKQREFRYRLKGVPVYFYSPEQIGKICADAGVPKYEIVRLQSGYMVAGLID